MRSTSGTGWRIGSVAVIGLLLLPVAIDRDSFPLSTYPMYSRARTSDVTIPTAVGIDDRGGEHRLTLQVIGASDDPLIVAGELRAAIAQERADDRCRAIADRASASLAAELDLVRIEVVMERHDVIAQVAGEPSLLARTVHAECVPEARS
ncbi:MAG: hypothetical protein ABWZ99_10720 [Ilumatobacteraceae bacterium]